MSDDLARIQRGHNHGLMIAGYSGVKQAVSSLKTALNYVEYAARGGIPGNSPAISMQQIEADLREILARVEAVNARYSTETREAA
ncbi:hypothetical protein LNAOJCKE_0909 [Methylorubrum aminovorans]|uniref:Uncharacterized protein n=1 Tax=Methylorubrum aminovorans TaxID=269069 RepID=A0ABQ4UAA2_9HYPH|nr:hypothetical protein [Methylorubrum aminovorans]GJE63711.1 hypothetical protein LNAOJCKE_0909 [Methylorubrum aminovorans]GMA73642.1 hypothetical protein GCM10025880_00590 [Methylorubrum aminovorans]GMA79828.1 hypothetical protein GCM10025880_62450 [Methylorubrum aminovorans]